jgi:branched-chain amino acid transport system substrate-binding protein
MKKAVLICVLVSTLVMLLVSGACSSASQAPTSKAPAAQPAAPATSAAAPTAAPAPAASAAPAAKPASSAAPASATSQASAPTKTLKIGVVCWLGFFVGIDMVHGLELMAEMDNQNGGIEINGEKYKIQLVEYDSNNVQATEVAAINRLVFEDKVDIILASPGFASSWIPITEQNKKLVFAYSPVTTSVLDAKYKYVYSANFMNDIAPVFAGWFAQAYPDLTKNIVIPVPDNQFGHGNSEKETAAWKAFGVTPTITFYPATQTDLSAVATKVVSLKPTSVYPLGMDMSILKALYEAGYKGQVFADNTASVQNLAKMVPIAALEGYIGGAWPLEFDSIPAELKYAQAFKAAWIAKYGKWESPEVVDIGMYACMKAAIQQANSLDVDKLASIIGNGLKFESPTGLGLMVNRPDLGIDRTMDSITAMSIKQVKNGQPVLIATVPLDQALSSVRKAYPASK